MAVVRIMGEKVERKVDGKNASDILHYMGINANSVIVLRDGRPIPEDEELSDEDEITVIRSFSGG
ncbi:MAG: MoaD/ThiS family protein [Thermoplasmata archaeon]